MIILFSKRRGLIGVQIQKRLEDLLLLYQRIDTLDI